jgi:hypothetical protein
MRYVVREGKVRGKGRRLMFDEAFVTADRDGDALFTERGPRWSEHPRVYHRFTLGRATVWAKEMDGRIVRLLTAAESRARAEERGRRRGLEQALNAVDATYEYHGDSLPKAYLVAEIRKAVIAALCQPARPVDNEVAPPSGVPEVGRL